MAKTLRTAKAISEYLAKRGFLLARRLDPYTCNGVELKCSRYYITNFRGGRCFKGTLAELKAHLKDTYYGEPQD